jgi:PAS domain S-box-containing protein
MKISREILSRIREILKTNPRGMNVTEVSKDLGMNRLTVAKYLEMLVVSGQVDVKRFGPAKVYFISHRLPISAMLSLSSDFVIILDRNLRIINVNDRFLEFTKMSREDLLYKGITNFSFPLEFNPSIIPDIKDALEGHESIVETYYQNKGIERYYEVKFIPMVLDGGEKGVTIFIVNITGRKRAEEALRRAHEELESRVKERTRELEDEIERRRKSEEALRASEEKYRSLIENIEDGVWEMDQDCRFTYMSPRMHDILGYRPEEVIGKTPYDLMQPDEMEGIRATILRIIEATGMLKLFECELLHKDGRRVPVELTASPIIDSNGVIQGYRGVTRDVTGRIKQ